MPGVMLVQAVYDDLTDPTADTAITTHHFNFPITPPTSADWGAFVTAWGTFWSAIDQHISTDLTNTQLRFYNLPPGGNAEAGQPVHIDETDRPGTNASVRLPPQVALSVTEETVVRGRWGRFYLPGLTTAFLGTGGRPSTGFLDEVVTAYHDLAESMALTNRGLVTYRRSDGTFQLVSGIRSDNVLDVIRRRRHSTTTFRSIQSVSD
jgi:hypothetical protein